MKKYRSWWQKIHKKLLCFFTHMLFLKYESKFTLGLNYTLFNDVVYRFEHTGFHRGEAIDVYCNIGCMLANNLHFDIKLGFSKND